MKSNKLNATFLLVMTSICTGLGQACCKTYLEDGNEKFRVGNYLGALDEYKKGLQCIDKQHCPELSTMYAKTNAIVNPKPPEKPSQGSRKPNETITQPILPLLIQCSSNDWQDARKSGDPCLILAHVNKDKVECTHKTDVEAAIRKIDDDRWAKVKESTSIEDIEMHYIRKCNQCPEACFKMEKAKERINSIRLLKDKEAKMWDKVKYVQDCDSIEQQYVKQCQLCEHLKLAITAQNKIIKEHSKPKLRLVTGGTFQMGNEFGREDKDYSYEDEEPLHQVTVKSFFMSEKELTFKEYNAFCFSIERKKPDNNNWSGNNLPVINIDWYDAVEYCNWRSKTDGFDTVYVITKPDASSGQDVLKKWIVEWNPTANGYRLPTEAEWEYAAKSGGKKHRFGNAMNKLHPTMVNFNPTYSSQFSEPGLYRKQTVPPGIIGAPNELGLFDLSGNVAEWCWDWYEPTYYVNWKKARDIAIDPKGPNRGTVKVTRGGAWYDKPESCRTSYRKFYLKPDAETSFLGMRVVRNHR